MLLEAAFLLDLSQSIISFHIVSSSYRTESRTAGFWLCLCTDILCIEVGEVARTPSLSSSLSSFLLSLPLPEVICLQTSLTSVHCQANVGKKLIKLLQLSQACLGPAGSTPSGIRKQPGGEIISLMSPMASWKHCAGWCCSCLDPEGSET